MRRAIGKMGPDALLRRAAAMVGLVVVVGLALPPLAAALRPLRERVASAGAAAAAAAISRSWGEEHAFFKRDLNDISPYSWNITGTYKELIWFSCSVYV
ncbi:hypothetical protein GUJ93_ZPchr0013g35878 [Zizania palustris]|uniref:Uncharacterized protein n=1 Tax=Zizania palustris TaxID=103762 RepID=A0A8J5X462_ZIZPA|nr:hypothetical protein GUJ93_ZPchr0013g35878 [Zizania palustris]